MDGPVIEMAFPLVDIPFPTRMVVVRLSSGALWIHSPTRLSEGLAAEIEALGPVTHLVSPNAIHYAWIPDWAARWPQATAWASPGVRERAASQGISVAFQADLQDQAPAAWAEDLDQLIFRGSSALPEVVFFHRASRTLLLTDLIENFERAHVRGPLWWLVRLAGTADPDGKAPLDLRGTYGGRDRREQARACLERMLAWAPERVILAHGRWYERDGVAELQRAFRWLR